MYYVLLLILMGFCAHIYYICTIKLVKPSQLPPTIIHPTMLEAVQQARPDQIQNVLSNPISLQLLEDVNNVLLQGDKLKEIENNHLSWTVEDILTIDDLFWPCVGWISIGIIILFYL